MRLVPREVVTDPCPDEDTLAALAERRLLASETRRLERHLDECPACRVLVAEVARSRSGLA
jgi:anti-sigma factor RsiW